MKKIAILIAVLALWSVFACSAENVVYFDEDPTVDFLSDLFNTDGALIPENVTVVHEVYMFDISRGDITAFTVDDYTLIGTTENLELLLLSLPKTIHMALSIRCIMTNQDGIIDISDFAYSTIEADTLDGNTFVLAYIGLLQPHSINIKQE
jgi:hypothetical protein